MSEHELKRVAAIGLRYIMEEFSETNWCAGWYSGLENILWDIVEQWPNLDSSYLEPYNAQLIGHIREIRDASGYWCVWLREYDEPQLMTIEEFLKWRQQQANGHRARL